jgi:hypothetical protein
VVKAQALTHTRLELRRAFTQTEPLVFETGRQGLLLLRSDP